MKQRKEQDIDLSTASSDLKSLIDIKRHTKSDEELLNQSDDGCEDEASQAQKEGFMLVYELFRPLTRSHLEEKEQEENKQA